MEISVEQKQGRVPVTVLSLHGDLDGSNYQEVIEKGKEAHAAGAKYLLLDMTDVPFMGSAGLVALHSLARLLKGQEMPDPEQGWAALHSASLDSSRGKQPFVKILNPQPSVRRGLERTGMADFFEIYPDLDEAIASF